MVTIIFGSHFPCLEHEGTSEQRPSVNNGQIRGYKMMIIVKKFNWTYVITKHLSDIQFCKTNENKKDKINHIL